MCQKIGIFSTQRKLFGFGEGLSIVKTGRSLSILALLGFAVVAFAQLDPQRDFVIAGKDAYLMLPPEFVCGPSLREMAWSPDGDHLAILRDYAEVSPTMMSDLMLGEIDPSSLEPESQILVWSMVIRKTTTLLKLKKSAGEVTSINWISGSSSMVVEGNFALSGETEPSHTSLLILNANGKTTNVRDFGAQEEHEILPSPYKPLVMILEHLVSDLPSGGPPPAGAQGGAVSAIVSGAPPVASQVGGAGSPLSRPLPSIRLFSTDGVVSEPITLPSPVCVPVWGKDGQIYVMSIERTPGEKKAKRIWYIVDRAARKNTPIALPPADVVQQWGGPDTKALFIEDLSARLADKKLGVRAPSVVIGDAAAKEKEYSVVTTDGSHGELSPTTNGVSYRSQGSLMVRPLVKISLEAYKKAREAAIKRRIINQAKQVALAMLMYSNDYDDNYLSNAGNWQSQLEPYLKDSTLTDGFTYTFTGGNSASIAEPANTQLGYIDGPGGRAVAYSDGHVRWIPNP